MKYSIQIGDLCETGMYDLGIKTIGDYTLIYPVYQAQVKQS